MSSRADEIAARVEAFVRETVVPYEKDPRRDQPRRRPTSWSTKCGRRRARPAC